MNPATGVPRDVSIGSSTIIEDHIDEVVATTTLIMKAYQSSCGGDNLNDDIIDVVMGDVDKDVDVGDGLIRCHRDDHFGGVGRIFRDGQCVGQIRALHNISMQSACEADHQPRKCKPKRFDKGVHGHSCFIRRN